MRCSRSWRSASPGSGRPRRRRCSTTSRRARPASIRSRRRRRGVVGGRLLMVAEVRLGMLGSGFIADHYVSGLRYVPGVRVVANASTGGERGAAFAVASRHRADATTRWTACAPTPTSTSSSIALPNHLHLEAVRAAVAARQGRRSARSRSDGTPTRRPRCSAWSARPASSTATSRTRSSARRS